MPRRIFAAGSVTNTTGAPLRLTFFPALTSTRRETDLYTVDSSSNLAERIPNGVILADASGVYSAFAGPDDVDTLYLNPHNGSARTAVTATSQVGARASETIGERVRRAAAKAHFANGPYLGVTASPPTFTTGTSNQDAALTKSYRTSVDGLGYFRFTGGTAAQGTSSWAPYVRCPVVTMPSGSGGNTSGDGTTNTYGWSIEFVTDSPRVMLRYFNSTTVYMVEVDDRPVSSAGLAFPSTTGTGYSLMDFTVGSATIVASTGVFTTSAAHGLQVGDQVAPGAITTTTGITAGTTYFVKTVPSTTTFTLSASPGGTALSLSGDGSTTAISKVAARKFRVEFQLAGAFDGVYVLPGYTVSPPVDENNVKVAIVGDSIDAGSTGITLPNAAWGKVAGKLLGWTDVRQVCFGGTGFVNAGSYNTYGAAGRIADAVAVNPDLLIIAASQNDDSQATLQATALTTLQAYRTALPTTPIIVLGADAGSSGPSAARLATEAAVLAAFNQWGDPRSWYIPVSNAADGAWFTGTGTTASRAGTGNRDRFGFDTSHPNDAGHAWRAQRFAAAFRTRVMPYL